MSIASTELDLILDAGEPSSEPGFPFDKGDAAGAGGLRWRADSRASELLVPPEQILILNCHLATRPSYVRLSSWMSAGCAPAMDCELCNDQQVELFDDPPAGLRFGEVWFNAWRHIQPDTLASGSPRLARSSRSSSPDLASSGREVSPRGKSDRCSHGWADALLQISGWHEGHPAIAGS